jgi:Mg-chelatase subunit ChlD
MLVAAPKKEKKMRRSPTNPSDAIHPAHIWFLLDRSGSMHALLEEVVLGLQEFVREQRLADPQARLTLVRFDSEDPHEVILDAERLATVDETRATQRFDPRAATPLYDAIATLIERADRSIADGGDDADQLLVIFTDGLENASTDCTRAQAFRLIKERRNRGWTFAFLGANQDAFAAGEAIGVAHGNTKNWEASREGTRVMLADLSQKSGEQLKRTRPQRRAKRDDFFGDDAS